MLVLVRIAEQADWVQWVVEGSDIDWSDVDLDAEPGDEVALTSTGDIVFAGNRFFRGWCASLSSFYVENRGGKLEVGEADARGAALNMGEEYLLSSIAVVVIGGTSVAGGYGNVPGLWGAALFLFLLVTMLNTFGAGAGVRLVLTGLIIIGVIVAASGGRHKRQG